MRVKRPAVVDEAGVEHHGDVATVAALDHLGHDVAAIQPTVLLPDLRRVIEKADMGMGVADNGLGARTNQRFYIAVGIELG